jgi:very-short-patch-repair endonuclease
MFQKGFFVGNNFCIVDFYLPKPYRICIEIDGGYHSTKKQAERDKNRTYYLEQQRGFKVVRINNDDVLSLTKESLIEKLNRKRLENANRS